MDYYRLDGGTDLKKRKSHVDNFNSPANTRSRLFLISTKAGGIGINLIGANRCIVFDASWNPSYDTQSIFRIYRFGQRKDVFVYRLLAQGTMEEKIYQRQVTKQGLAQRVIDEHQLDRHFTSAELRELYSFEPQTSSDEVFNIPKDDLLKSLLRDYRDRILKYHEHDLLLENKTDEVLSEAERLAAWEEYENERNRPSYNDLNAAMQARLAESVIYKTWHVFGG
jgi:transcriptional regulator ATRX